MVPLNLNQSVLYATYFPLNVSKLLPKSLYNLLNVYSQILFTSFKVRPCNELTDLQQGRSFKNFILLKHMSFTDDPPDRPLFTVFFIFYNQD